MTIEIGRLVEIGYVVSDIEAAARLLHQTMGAGPFRIYEDLEMRNVRVSGIPASVPIDIALGASGNIVIELVRARDDAASPFHSPDLRPGQLLFNHWSVFTSDFDAESRRLKGQGFSEAFFAEIMNDTTRESARLAYFESERHPGAYFEIMEADPPVLLMSYQEIIATSEPCDTVDCIVRR